MTDTSPPDGESNESASSDDSSSANQRSSEAAVSSRRQRKRPNRMTRGIIGPKRPKKEHGLVFKVATRTLLGFSILFVFGIIALFIAYQRTEIPQPNAAALQQQSIIYYDDGKTEIGRFNNTTREDVTFERIPEHVRYAFLSAEDRSFYENRGVSPTGIVRAFWTNVRGQSTAGGSTITQQYVKNYFLTQDQTVTRKFKEVMISLKIDRKMSKDDILQNYLNTIYFGRGAYGIQAASKAYFNKDVSKLTVSEGAFLSSVVNAPSRFDPALGQRAETRVGQRMNYVLDGMVEQGWLTAANRPTQMPTFQPIKKRAAPGPNGYIRDLVESELKSKLDLSEEDIERGGLRITTTINKKSQDAAAKAVRDKLPDSTQGLHVGLAAQKPNDGAIVAVYNGKNALEESPTATYETMQAGSTFKVFGMIGALEDGMTLNSTFSGRSPSYFKEYRSSENPTGSVTNFGGASFGNVTLKMAVTRSINTAFLHVNEAVGPTKTMSIARDSGINLADDDAKHYMTLSNVLGTAPVRMMDLATAYNTINSGGAKYDPYYIAKVTSVRGDYSYTHKVSKKQVYDEKIAANAVSAMQTVVADPRGSAYRSTHGLDPLNRPAAGKTGTTNNNMSVLFAGFTPQLTGSVGIYRTAADGKTRLPLQGIAGINAVTGGDFPTAIWSEFMKAALAGEPVEEFKEAPDLQGSFTRTREPQTNVVPPPATSEQEEPSSTEPPETSTSTTAPPETSTTQPPTSTPPPPTTPVPTQTPTRTVVPPSPPTRPTVRPSRTQQADPPPPGDGQQDQPTSQP